MIRLFRKQLSDKGFRVILWVSVAAFMFSSLVPILLRRFGSGGDGLIATVNGMEISAGEFLKRVQYEQNRLALFRQQFGKQADQLMMLFGLSNNPEEAAFMGLQQEKIIDSVARDLNLEIAPSYILSRLQDSDFLSQQLGLDSTFIDALGKIDMAKLRNVLRQKGMSIADLEEMIERQLRRSFVLNFAQAAAYTPEFSVRKKFIQEFVPRKYSILLFSQDHYLDEMRKESVDDETLQKFFEKENRKSKRYFIPEKRSGHLWTFDPFSYGIDVSDQELERRYTKNKKNYLVTPETITVYKVVFPISEGDDIGVIRQQAEEKLKTLRESPNDFPQEETQIIERGKSKDSIARAAFALKEDSDISDIIKNKEEMVILKRAHHEDPQYKSLAEVRDDIKDTLVVEKFKRQFPLDARRVINEGNVQCFIEKAGASKSEISDQEKTTELLINKLFSLGLEKYGYALAANNEMGYIVQATQIDKGHFPELATVKKEVLDDYYCSNARKKLESEIEKARQLITTSGEKEIERIAEETAGVSLITTDFIEPGSQDTLNELKEKGVPTSVMLSLTVPGSIKTEIPHEQGVLIYLNERSEINEDDYEKEKPSIERSLTAQTEGPLQSSFVASLFKNATIKMYAPGAKNKKRL